METQIMVRLRGSDIKLKTKLEAVAKRQRRSLNQVATIALELGLKELDNKA
jgi:hypothetical protein